MLTSLPKEKVMGEFLVDRMMLPSEVKPSSRTPYVRESFLVQARSMADASAIADIIQYERNNRCNGPKEGRHPHDCKHPNPAMPGTGGIG